MAPHSSTLAWKIPWTEEPGRLQSMGSLSRTRLSDFTFTLHFHNWRRKWQPTPVFLPGESQGPGSLVGFRLWGRTESDTTEATQQQQQQQPSLSITNSQSLLRLMSIESVMPSNHLILCPRFSSCLQSFPASGESVLHIRWPKYWSSASASVLPVNIQG